MRTLANRVFARLILAASALGGFLVLVALELLILGAGADHSEAPDLLCVVAPVSTLDIGVHVLAVVISALTGVGILAGARAFSRTRASVAELRAAALGARLATLPARLVGPAMRAAVLDQVDVVAAPRPFAFVYGWFRPRICISAGMVELLSDQEMEAVLHHEGWHVARRDPLRFLIAQTVGAVFATVPPIRRMVYLFQLSAEVAADQYAVLVMGHPRSLASALVKTIVPSFVEPGFEGQTDARIAALAGESPTMAPWGGWIIATVLVAELIILVPLLQNGSIITLVGFWTHPVC